MKKVLTVLLISSLAACATWGTEGLSHSAAGARAFLNRFDAEYREYYRESSSASWVAATHITDDTQQLSSRAYERSLGYLTDRAREARRFDGVNMHPLTARQFDLLKHKAAAPTTPSQLREYTELTSKLEAMYGSGRYCPAGPESCQDLRDLERIMDHSRDPDALLSAWLGWRTVARPMKAPYQRFAELENVGARELGYADAGDLWRAGYDLPAVEFAAEVERLWEQVRPLYEELHCTVRAELRNKYGDLVPANGPIPAHLLGNMWAQQWSNIYDLVTPFPAAPSIDVTQALKQQGYTARQMVEQAEGFYVGLGMPALPRTFYERSLLTKPRDREVVCHASAWTLDLDLDVRIKMCIEPDAENLTTIYHELGHIYYDLAYNGQPYLFQRGAHDGFHEAIGDTMVLAMTPSYLQSVGLARSASADPRAVVNWQMRMALDKIAFLPFGKLVDQWRWRVFAGEVGPEHYTQAWWDLKLRYQGIAPPVARSPEDFDPGAKYHIPGNTPYMRYFLAHIMQFQFYKAMCDAAGFQGPLHECSFAGSKVAGQRMWDMLAKGQSQPWPETMAILTGHGQMDAAALLEYFAPLREWLAKENSGRSCGW